MVRPTAARQVVGLWNRLGLREALDFEIEGGRELQRLEVVHVILNTSVCACVCHDHD